MFNDNLNENKSNQSEITTEQFANKINEAQNLMIKENPYVFNSAESEEVFDLIPLRIILNELYKESKISHMELNNLSQSLK